MSSTEISISLPNHRKKRFQNLKLLSVLPNPLYSHYCCYISGAHTKFPLDASWPVSGASRGRYLAGEEAEG